MNSKTISKTNPTENYPIYKRDGENLIRQQSKDPNRRYRTITNAQTGETHVIQFTDEEEAQAEKERIDWEAGAPAREAEAKRQAYEAEQFDKSLRYENRIVAFLDILGWKNAVMSKGCESENIPKALGRTLAQLKWISNHFNSLNGLVPEGMKWPGNPVMTQFSDSLVISVDDDERGKSVLENALYIITSNLIEFGLLLRGGVSKGELYHSDGLVYGPALIDAYELESKFASTPRIILSKEFPSSWGHPELAIGSPWILSPDGYLFFNFLPPFMGNEFFRDQQQLWQTRLEPIRKLILNKALDANCADDVFSKYIWLAGYFDSICAQYPNCGVDKVLELAMQTRWSDKPARL